MELHTSGLNKIVWMCELIMAETREFDSPVVRQRFEYTTLELELGLSIVIIPNFVLGLILVTKENDDWLILSFVYTPIEQIKHDYFLVIPKN